MLRVTFRFYGNLNDFLPEPERHAIIVQHLHEHAAVKHTIEALGAPHPEVAAILVNRAPVDFAYRLQEGDHVEVYPLEVVHLLRSYLPLRPPVPAPVVDQLVPRDRHGPGADRLRRVVGAALQVQG